VLVYTPLPPLAPFVVLALLVVLAEHQFVLFGDETSMSASIIVVVASIFVFADTSPLAGPMLIASLGGLYLPHIRRRDLALVTANAAIFSVAAGVAAALGSGVEPTSTLVAYGSAGAVIAAYWYSNSALVGLASAIRNGTPVGTSIRNQAWSEWTVLLLAASSAALANVHEHARLLPLVLSIASLLVLFQISICLRHREAASRSPWPIGAVAVITGLTCTSVEFGYAGSAFALAGAFWISSQNWHRCGSGPAMTSHPMAALAVASTISLSMYAVGASLAIRFALASYVAFATMTMLRVQGFRMRSRRYLPPLVVAGLLIPRFTSITLVASLGVLLDLGPSPLTASFVLVSVLAASVVGCCASAKTRLIGQRSWGDAFRRTQRVPPEGLGW
jgi:hypothetical protein